MIWWDMAAFGIQETKAEREKACGQLPQHDEFEASVDCVVRICLKRF